MTATPAVTTETPCPSCGRPSSGRFCSGCGAARLCGRCEAPLSPGAHFCHRCGQSTGGRTAPGDRAPWILAWSLIVVTVAFIAWFVLRKPPEQVRPEMANVGAAPGVGGAPGGTPPDISQMTPRERFDRLYDRIVRALEQGDTVTVTRFSPMAFAAYGMLDSTDALARYDVGTLHATLGEFAQASALADTIQAASPNHLFADMLRGMVAEFRGDKAGLARSYQQFLAHYDAEIQARRPEYDIHKPLVDEFHDRAVAAKGR
jgi:hypothetical protein